MTEWLMFHGWSQKLGSYGLGQKVDASQFLIARALLMAFNLDGSFLGGGGRGIRQSVIGYLYAIGGLSSAGLILVFGGPLFFPVTVISILGIGGMVLSLEAPKFDKDFEDEPPAEENEKTLLRTTTLSIVALAAFVGLYWVLSPLQFSNGAVTYTAFFSTFKLPFSTTAEQASTAAFLVFTVPWGEENFFRGLWGNLLIKYLPEGMSELTGGVIFMTFHAAVYGLYLGPQWGLIGLLTGAGSVFIGVDVVSGDIGTSELSHSAYNLLSLGVKGSVLTALIGPPPASLVPQSTVFIIVPALAAALVFRKKGKGVTTLGGALAGMTRTCRAALSLVQGDACRALGSGGDGGTD